MARSLAALAATLYRQDRLEEALALDRRAVAGLPDESAEQAAVLAVLGSHLAFSGDFEQALAATESALAIAEPLEDWQTVVRGFNTLANVRERSGRVEESTALRERALKIALAHDLTADALRSYNNLANGPLQHDRFQDACDIASPGLALAKARGHRDSEQYLALMVATANVGLGRWDMALELAGTLDATGALTRLGYLPSLARIQAARADTEMLQSTLELAVAEEGSSNTEYGPSATVARAIALNALGRPSEALRAALVVAMSGSEVANEDRREAYVEAGLAALALDDQATVERLIEYVAELPPAMRSPLLRAGAARFGGLLAQRRGRDCRGGGAADGGDARVAGDRSAVRAGSGAGRARRAAARLRARHRRRAIEGRSGRDLRASARRPVAAARAGGRLRGCRMRGDALTSCRSCGGQPDRFAARIAARQAGPRAAESLLGRAEAAFAEHEDPFSYAVVALEHVEAAAGEPEAEALAGSGAR